MATNIYPCFKCGKWFDTKGLRSAHKCGSVPEPKEEKVEEVAEEKAPEVTEEVEVESPTVEDSSSEEDADFDREEAVKALKEAEVIADGRAVSKKSDEELKEMLKEIEA